MGAISDKVEAGEPRGPGIVSGWSRKNSAAARIRPRCACPVVLLNFTKFLTKEKVRLAVKCGLLTEYHVLDVLQH
jgi:hypothetical protein